MRDAVLAAAAAVLPGVEGQCAGSFRRGKPASGDVDLIFTHPAWCLCPDGGGSGGGAAGGDGGCEAAAEETYAVRKRFLLDLVPLQASSTCVFLR